MIPSQAPTPAGTTRATALRTLDAAWRRIPEASTLTVGTRIRILPGTIAEGDAPNYWEDRWGTATAPIIVEAEDGPGTAHLPPINAYGLRYAYFLDIAIANPNDPFHCERCDHLLLRDVTLHGSDAHETLKVNQSTNVYVEGSTIGGADDNAIDFVAVRGGHLRGNTVGPAGEPARVRQGRLGAADRPGQPLQELRHGRLHRRPGRRRVEKVRAT